MTTPKSNTPTAASSTSPTILSPSMSTKLLLLCLATSSSSCTAYAPSSSSSSSSTGCLPQHYLSPPRPTCNHRRQKCHRRIALSTAKVSTVLFYRDGNDDQPLTMQVANQSAVVAFTATDASVFPSPLVPTPTKELVTTPTGRPISNHFTKSAPMVPFPTASIRAILTMPRRQRRHEQTLRDDQLQQRQQLVMDEYLEFVQRRYNRLQIVTSSKSVPTLSNRPSMDDTRRRVLGAHGMVEKDPLQVLGLVNLASARLRQRLHAPTTKVGSISTSTRTAIAFITQQVVWPSRTIAAMSTHDVLSLTTAPAVPATATAAATTNVSTIMFNACRHIKDILESIHRMTCLLVAGGGIRHSVRLLGMMSVLLGALASRKFFKPSG